MRKGLLVSLVLGTTLAFSQVAVSAEMSRAEKSLPAKKVTQQKHVKKAQHQQFNKQKRTADRKMDHRINRDVQRDNEYYTSAPGGNNYGKPNHPVYNSMPDRD